MIKDVRVTLKKWLKKSFFLTLKMGFFFIFHSSGVSGEISIDSPGLSNHTHKITISIID